VTIPGLASYRFGDEGDVLAASLGASEAAVEDAWYRSVLPLVLQARGTQVLHASAVWGRAGVVALCGTSTAGKSTLAWALEGRGYTVVADDALPFVLGNGRALVRALPHRLRLRPDALSHHRVEPDESLRDPGDEWFPLPRVVLLGHSGVTSGKQLSSLESFTALLPHAYCFDLDDVGGKAALTDAYLELANLATVVPLFVRKGLEHLEETADELERLLLAA
jgi:hypothetical protein